MYISRRNISSEALEPKQIIKTNSWNIVESLVIELRSTNVAGHSHPFEADFHNMANIVY